MKAPARLAAPDVPSGKPLPNEIVAARAPNDETVRRAPALSRASPSETPRAWAAAGGLQLQRSNPVRCTVPEEREKREPTEASTTAPDPAVAARVLARSFYKELRSRGYGPNQLLAVSSELIGLVTQDLKSDREELSRAA